MLQLSEFKALMLVVEVAREQLHCATRAFDALFEDFQGVPRNMGIVEDALIDTLEHLTGNTGLVEYWVYDCDMGNVPFVLTYDDGTEIQPSTVEDLYAFIIAKQKK